MLRSWTIPSRLGYRTSGASASLLWLVASLVWGCDTADDPGGSDTGGTGGTAGMSGSTGSGGSAGSGTGCAITMEPGAVIVVDCATKVTLRDGGNGFRPPAPAGSECHGERTYSVDLIGGELTWSLCIVQGSEPWQLDKGQRALPAQELANARTKLETVTVWNGQRACGADKPTLTIEVETPAGKQIYTDSFYACNATGAPFVDNIDAAFSTLMDLATP